MADDLDYVPMPAAVKELVRKPWAANIKDASGKPVALEVRLGRAGRCRARRVLSPRRRPSVAATLPALPRRATPSSAEPTRRSAALARAATSPWADALFSALAHGAAWLTLALLVGIIGLAGDRRRAGDHASTAWASSGPASGIRSRTSTAAW